jgi:hypothetical protein
VTDGDEVEMIPLKETRVDDVLAMLEGLTSVGGMVGAKGQQSD